MTKQTLKLADGTIIKARKCADCGKEMAFTDYFYYCQNQLCKSYDEPQWDVCDDDIVEGQDDFFKIPPKYVAMKWQICRKTGRERAIWRSKKIDTKEEAERTVSILSAFTGISGFYIRRCSK